MTRNRKNSDTYRFNGIFGIIFRVACNDTFEKSRFMMEMVSTDVDSPSAVEFGIR